MRIAIDARMVRQPLSGPGRYALGLIRSLEEVDRKNRYLILQNAGLSEKVATAENFKTIRVGYPALCLRTVFWLQNLLKNEKIDILHSPYFLTPWSGGFAKIITVHDLMALRFPGFFQGRSLPVRAYASLFTNVFLRSSVSLSSQIVTDSQTVKDEVLRWKPECEGRITVIRPAVDPAFRKMNNHKPIERIRSRFGLTERIILYVGNTRPYKNLPRLIRAFALLAEERETRCQLVIGGGESRNLSLLRMLAKDLQIEGRLVFTGNLTDEELVALMNAAHLFVFPSLYEGFGLPPLEAMACGTPVITSNAGSLPEVVGDAAWLVNPEKEQEIFTAIKTLSADERLRQEFINKGHERVKLFSWRKTAEETLELYERTAKRG
jgi:glycosyltransferase involved in cell wall biosynthesis